MQHTSMITNEAGRLHGAMATIIENLIVLRIPSEYSMSKRILHQHLYHRERENAVCKKLLIDRRASHFLGHPRVADYGVEKSHAEQESCVAQNHRKTHDAQHINDTNTTMDHTTPQYPRSRDPKHSTTKFSPYQSSKGIPLTPNGNASKTWSVSLRTNIHSGCNTHPPAHSIVNSAKEASPRIRCGGMRETGP
jgi:hypothetical protein